MVVLILEVFTLGYKLSEKLWSGAAIYVGPLPQMENS